MAQSAQKVEGFKMKTKKQRKSSKFHAAFIIVPEQVENFCAEEGYTAISLWFHIYRLWFKNFKQPVELTKWDSRTYKWDDLNQGHKQVQLSWSQKSRALKKLEDRGLVEVARRQGQEPIVNIPSFLFDFQSRLVQ